MNGKMRFPGFVDVHVHFRDPGVPGAETTLSGLAAAESGGFGAVVTMPNTSPACDSPEIMQRQRDLSQGSAVRLLTSACITRGRLGSEVADLERLAAAGAAFFTDDGSYVCDDRVMEQAMRRAAALGMCVSQHALDPRLVAGGVIRDCALARRSGLRTIDPLAETAAISRDIALCRVTGCRIHIQHISTAGGVSLVRDAQAEGLPVTAEATPHHLLIACEDIVKDDANFKMAPPLGNREDRAELRRAVKDGVLMFATDHAPHAAETKSNGFAGSANGIVGLETAIPITYAVMVEECGMDVESWARAWYGKPRAIVGTDADRDAIFSGIRDTVISVGELRSVDPERFLSKSRNCPYGGLRFSCWAGQS